MGNLLKTPIIINAVLFQILWFACVLGGAYQLLWPAMLAGVVMLAWQLHPERRHDNDLKVLVAAIILGCLIDTGWVVFGILEFNDPRPASYFAPIWIIIMWMGFALTVNHSLGWLSAHPLLPALTGLIGGPMAYFAGLRLGAVEYLTDPLLTSALLGLAWAIALTILVQIGIAEDEPAGAPA